MNALAQLDPRKVQVVEMRFFGGLSVEETAEVLKVSAVTVMRDWSTAKAWLYRELTGGKTMDSERWKQVDDLLQAALERPPEEREAFLRQCLRRRQALEREVRSLLTAQQDGGSISGSSGYRSGRARTRCETRTKSRTRAPAPSSARESRITG